MFEDEVFPQTKPSAKPTEISTASPSSPGITPSPTRAQTAHPSSAGLTFAPTGAPSVQASPAPTASPTAAPTRAPTSRSEYVSGNGGCEADEQLFVLFMHDQGGDGWDDTQISIAEENVFGFKETAFKGTLDDGKVGMEYVCLKYFTCYHAAIQGGVWEEEIRWELRPVVLGTKPEEYKYAVAKGAAPVDCSFSFGNRGYPACETTCLSWARPTPAPKAKPTSAPTVRPTPSPTMGPTAVPTDEPTTVPTIGPTAAPTSGPTPVPTGGPTSSPSQHPTASPTNKLTDRPSLRPTVAPTNISTFTA